MSIVDNLQSFGDWVKTRRRKLDLTQAELGKRAGCSAAAIRKVEADERKPSKQLAETLASALEIAESDREIFLQMARGVFTDKLPGTPIDRKQSNPNNLPALLTSTIERTHDLSAATSLIREVSNRLVTLLGPPGIGKTRLSIHAGTELLPDFPDGVWFVDLAELENGAFFAGAVSRSLEFLELPPSPGIPQLIAGLKERKLLLILDNFEHIVDQAAVDVAQILKSCPELKTIATSRVPLHIYGEHEYPLPSLSLPPRGNEKDPDALMGFEAVQLLVARIRQHHPKFSVTPENAEAVIEICNILEGLPLALELAASSLHRMTLDEMVSLLNGFHSESWVSQIGTQARDLPKRQRTLENVVAWSYSLLTESQQDLFCRLGIFSGWFDDEAAMEVCFNNSRPPLAKVHEELEELSDKSLLVRDFQNGIPCWRMLELIHEYASLRLGLEIRMAVGERHALYFLRRLKSINQETDLKKREGDFHLHAGNLHSAIRWAIENKDTELGFQLAWNMDDLWMNHGYSREGLELLKHLFALPDQSDPLIRISRLQMAADLAWHKAEFETSMAFSRETAALANEHGLKAPYLWFLNRQGRIFIEQGLYEEARKVLEECHSKALADPSLINPGTPLAQLGEIDYFEGRLDDAKSKLEVAIRFLTETDDTDYIFISIAHTDLAEVALAQQDFPKARYWLEKAKVYAGINIRRTLVFLCAATGNLILSPDRKKSDFILTAQLYGAIDAVSERSGIILNSFYQKTNSERMAIAQKQVTPDDWKVNYLVGQHLTREQAIDIAKQALALD